MLYGYMRTSPAENDAHEQLNMLQRAACNQVFKDENAAGGLSKCPGLKACLAELKPKDVLVVWKLDKLGRNLHELLTITDNLFKRGIHLNSLFEKINTIHPQDREIIYRIFKALHEYEKNQLVRRTQEGRVTQGQSAGQ
jgi:DNA invertase Pin-like site-specific DNA recombinase